MKLLFERSIEGRSCALIPNCDVPTVDFGSNARTTMPALPQISEIDLGRHYTELAKQTHGVNNGFYPLGSCTMKYNPRINEEMAALPGFTQIHPLQPESTVQGCLEVMYKTSELLCNITGMDAMTMQPAAGAHGEFTGLQLIRAYHVAQGDANRTKIIVPDSAHGTNPASASMVGFEIIEVQSNADGGINLDHLSELVGPDTAGLMLTSPNTIGKFNPKVIDIARIIHNAGGLCYYDGANLNAIMGHVSPGEVGFDCVHLNLHKTFSAPHGGGGPGSGPVGCKNFLAHYLPGSIVVKSSSKTDSAHTSVASNNKSDKQELSSGKDACENTCENTRENACKNTYTLKKPVHSVGNVKSFYGNFLVVVRALTYILTLGKEGIPEASAMAVLNANYLLKKLHDLYSIPFGDTCFHEFVMDIEPLKKETGVSAMDVAKRLLDFSIHPPTMYFPLIVHEALMVEPTETESKETLDLFVDILRKIYQEAQTDGEKLHDAPFNCPISRPDEVKAARHAVLRYTPHA